MQDGELGGSSSCALARCRRANCGGAVWRASTMAGDKAERCGPCAARLMRTSLLITRSKERWNAAVAGATRPHLTFRSRREHGDAGFLTELAVEFSFPADSVLGDFTAEPRDVRRRRGARAGRDQRKYRVLNDATINRAPHPHREMEGVRVSSSVELSRRWLIISPRRLRPISAGGPIVYPTMSATAHAHLPAHADQPPMLPDSLDVEIAIATWLQRSSHLDGQEGLPLTEYDRVSCHKSPTVVGTVRAVTEEGLLPGAEKKLKWGEDCSDSPYSRGRHSASSGRGRRRGYARLCRPSACCIRCTLLSER